MTLELSCPGRESVSEGGFPSYHFYRGVFLFILRPETELQISIWAEHNLEYRIVILKVILLSI